MVVTKKEAQQKYFYCINFQTRIHAVVSDNRNHVRPPRRLTKKETRKFPIASSATKRCTSHEKSGHCTHPEKPGRCARHMNENNIQTNDGRKGKPINELHRKKIKIIYTYEKRKICV